MSLEDNIKSIIEKKLTDGTVEKLVEKNFENGINNALEELFQSYGDVTRLIKEKIKSVMVPYIEKYDYSEYLTKLDQILTEVLSQTTVGNRKILENFKDLMKPVSLKEIKSSDLFEKYQDYVSDNVSTDDLEVSMDDGPCYEPVQVYMEFKRDEDSLWEVIKNATLEFTCEQDETLNFTINLYHFDKDPSNKWYIFYKAWHDLSSLSTLSPFEILVMTLNQANTKVIIDEEALEQDVEVEEEPEAHFD